MAVLTRILFISISWLLLMALPVMAWAADNLQLREQEIKAGLLYNFLKYTSWPETGPMKDSPINVCIFGDDPFEGGLYPMTERTVKQRRIKLIFIRHFPEIDACHMLFINARKKDSWPELHQLITGKSILTVSDFPSFAASGGMLEFGRKDKHISVNLNLKAVTDANLQVEERLLKLVTVIDSEPSG